MDSDTQWTVARGERRVASGPRRAKDNTMNVRLAAPRTVPLTGLTPEGPVLVLMISGGSVRWFERHTNEYLEWAGIAGPNLIIPPAKYRGWTGGRTDSNNILIDPWRAFWPCAEHSPGV